MINAMKNMALTRSKIGRTIGWNEIKKLEERLNRFNNDLPRIYHICKRNRNDKSTTDQVTRTTWSKLQQVSWSLIIPLIITRDYIERNLAFS